MPMYLCGAEWECDPSAKFMNGTFIYVMLLYTSGLARNVYEFEK